MIRQLEVTSAFANHFLVRRVGIQLNRIGLIVASLLLVLMLASSTLFIVDQRQFAVVYARGEIKEVMKRSRELGMQTFDQALFDLYEGNHITYEDALRNADSVNDLRLHIKLQGKESKDRDLTAGVGHLDII